MNLIIGADKGGFALKEAIAAHLRDCGQPYNDMGTLSPDKPVNYMDIASSVCAKISSGAADRAILICGTGMGMAIASNKFKGVRAAVVESLYAALYSRKINDANVLCMGGFIVGASMGCEITDAFLGTDFLEGFPQWRIDFLNSQRSALIALEDQNFK